jgi:hypothetical protein
LRFDAKASHYQEWIGIEEIARLCNMMCTLRCLNSQSVRDAITAKGAQIVRVKGDTKHPLSQAISVSSRAGQLHYHDQVIVRPAMRSGG